MILVVVAVIFDCFPCLTKLLSEVKREEEREEEEKSKSGREEEEKREETERLREPTGDPGGGAGGRRRRWPRGGSSAGGWPCRGRRGRRRRRRRNIGKGWQPREKGDDVIRRLPKVQRGKRCWVAWAVEQVQHCMFVHVALRTDVSGGATDPELEVVVVVVAAPKGPRASLKMDFYNALR